MATELDALVEGLAVETREHVKAKLAPLVARLEAVERAQADPAPRWRDVYEAGRVYARGDLVTKGGSLWLALEATTRTPGEAGSGWRLIVKGAR